MYSRQTFFSHRLSIIVVTYTFKKNVKYFTVQLKNMQTPEYMQIKEFSRFLCFGELAHHPSSFGSITSACTHYETNFTFFKTFFGCK